MLPEETQCDFGRYLQAYRLAIGRSLDDIAQHTKITKSCLQQIENENLQKLPQPVFVRGLLRSYADAVGGDAEEAYRRYRHCCKMRHSFDGTAEKISFRMTFWPRFGLALLLFFAVVAITLYAAKQHISTGDNQAPLIGNEGVDGSRNANRLSNNEEQEVRQAVSKSMAAAPAFKLKAFAVALTKLKIIADGGAPKEYQLQPGEKIVVTAESHFNLLIGDADGVHLELNDKIVTIPGKSGQLVTLDLP